MDDGLHVSLAPLYDKLDKRHMEMMPDTLKVAIAGAVTALQMNRATQREGPFDWLVVENLLTTTPHLYPVGERTEYHEDVEIAREMRPDELSILAQVRWAFFVRHTCGI